MLSLIDKASPILRQKAAPVTPAEFSSPALLELIKGMRQALESCEDGIALAAPQVGVSQRLFIISEKINRDRRRRLAELTFINPVITRRSRETLTLEEGCLSLRHLYGETRRAAKVTVTAADEHGEKFTYHGSGLIAQIFQHEIDHLDGILFTDQASNLHEVAT